MSDIDIEIDGKPLKAKPNSMVIQVADEAGIYIPRFCYHKSLTVAANCRMCLVEVEKSPKALPACATPVMPGMKVFTRSAKALAAQRAVMEFLLINHPLDCPICDQGGECELQDLTMGYGPDRSFYREGKRSVKDYDIGPLIATDMTRCIQCTRCVRFGDEIAGLRELGAVGRGEDMEISTYVRHAMHSEVSGNIIDLCPVGALTSKPFRFKARAWELNQYPSIAPHDGVGTNINIHTRNGQVMRVVPRENRQINETWMSDRDRYSYEGLYHADRLSKPRIRVGSEWCEVDWPTAFAKIVESMQSILKKSGAENIGALASPSATLEEYYLLQKVMRSLGSSNIDHRLRQIDFQDQEQMPLFPGLSGSIADLEQMERIILIGSNIQKEQPLLALRIRKAALKGADVIAFNMMDYPFHFKLAAKKISSPHQFVASLIQLDEFKQLFDTTKKTAIILGAPAFNHPEASAIRTLAYQLKERLSAVLHLLPEGGNAAGAWLAGAVPHRALHAPLEKLGRNAQTMLTDPCKAYFLLNVEPDTDCANPIAAEQALHAAECVVALSLFKNPLLEKTAHVILPMTPFTETSGTFVNVEGAWQSFKGAATPFGEARPAWKILRVLGNILHLNGFDFTSSEEVLQEIKTLQTGINEPARFVSPVAAHTSDAWSRVGDIPFYKIDSIVRRAPSLQAAERIIAGDLGSVRLHPTSAADLQWQAGDLVTVTQDTCSVTLPLQLDERVPVKAVFLAGGCFPLPELFGTLKIAKA